MDENTAENLGCWALAQTNEFDVDHVEALLV
jgi:hypothetical protein